MIHQQFNENDLALCENQPSHYSINEFYKGQRVSLNSCHGWEFEQIPWMEVLGIDDNRVICFYQNEICDFNHLCLIIHPDDLRQ